MNIEADIKWIKKELNSVKDKELIDAFKNMLKFRRKHLENQLEEQIKTLLTSRALKSEEDIVQGKVYTKEEAFNKLNKA